jgi:DNA-binding winged helix-turn-helix (wHTH) protein/Tol biopolymer transport system component
MPEPSSSTMGYRFGLFEVDLRAGEIRKRGLRIKLQEQPFQVLILLLRHSPNPVSREEIRKRLWDEDTFVEFDHGLSNAVSRIREALGDSAENARFIETLPKRGYRFIAPVEQVVTAAHSLVSGNGAKKDGAHSESQPPHNDQQQARARQAKPAAHALRAWPRNAIYAVPIAIVAVILAVRVLKKKNPGPVNYTQVTNFGDAVSSPAISPDGRMIAFVRGSDASFPTVGELYTKILPDGEPVQLTHDGWPKYGVTYSPDGSQIAYTVAADHGWNTMTISALGGEPRLMIPNASGLTWLDEHHVLFSEINTGLHMGLVTSTDTRSEPRDIYWPEHQRGMAHFSYASPDRKWVLVVEMGATGAWQRCRLVPFDGSSEGSQVGPPGACTSAAWSPDGRWMYFSASVKGFSHLWRQPFPNGEPERITGGPTEERDLAMARDGRSVISAVGMNESGMWLRDSHGERLISSEGYAANPSFSRDGRHLYYLLRRESLESPRELWVTEIESGKSEPVIQGFAITRYDISSDEREVIFATHPPDSPSQLWLASCDHEFAPRMLTSSGEDSPFFGLDGTVVFRKSEGRENYLFRMRKDGSGRTKVMPGPIINLMGASPDGKWAVAAMPVNEVPSSAIFAVPIEGGAVKKICPAICMAKWSPDGTRFYVEPLLQGARTGMTAVIPVPTGKSLPALPMSGIRTAQDSAALPGSVVIDMSSFDPSRVGQNVAPGPAPDSFAHSKTIAYRNLFQIPLP